MENAKGSTRKKQAPNADSLKLAFMEYVLTEGKRPASVFKFCKDLGITEADFYSSYGSFESLERAIWKGFADDTLQALYADESYASFNSRERVLSFFYTLLEVLKRNRSYILMHADEKHFPGMTPGYLKDFKAAAEDFFKKLKEEGTSAGEIANRPYLDQLYPQAFWMHLEFILHFWKNDDSAGFENTDAAVEKSVNLAFDLIGKGTFDRAVDFAKFLYQNKK